MTEQSNEPPVPPDPSVKPDYEDFRDESGAVDWRAFRAAVAAYDPRVETEAAPPGEGGAAVTPIHECDS